MRRPAAPTLYQPPQDLGARLARRRVRRETARPALLQPARPTVSFTFDGPARSAARTGASILENIGARGTFYASAGLAGAMSPVGPMFAAEDVARLLAAGHEIGCATFSHRDCARMSLDGVLADMVRNADALAAMGMESRLVSFAYPYGETTAALKAALPSRFASARGTHRGLASGKADLAQLRACAMAGPGALQRCLAALKEAQRRGGWVIFHAHDVGPRPSPWGVPTGALERLCGAAFTASMRVLPVRDALAAIREESAA